MRRSILIACALTLLLRGGFCFAQLQNLRTELRRGETVSTFDEAIERIGQCIAWGSVSGKADVLFLIDTGVTMLSRESHYESNLSALSDSLARLGDTLDRAEIDYRLRALGFHEFGAEKNLDISGWSSDLSIVQRRITDFGAMGEMRTLDVIFDAYDLVAFRSDADAHIVLATDSPAETSWGADGAVSELQRRAKSQAVREGIRAHALGYSESFQQALARETGGLFVPMPVIGGGSRPVARWDPDLVTLPPNSLDATFREIAEHVIEGREPRRQELREPLEILLFVDYSRSMQGRLRAVMDGLKAFGERVRAVGIPAQYTVFRVASPISSAQTFARSDVIEAVADASETRWYFADPARGTELFVDYLAETLPSRTADAALIITDEPPVGKTHTAEDMETTIRESGMTFYAVCPQPSDMRRESEPLNALLRAVETSGGRSWPMPSSLDFQRSRK